jgi:hypothetical protein
MSRQPSARVPSYRLHKQSGSAIVTLTDGLGGRRDVLLGRHGTAASRAAYARTIAEWEARGRGLPTPVAGADPSVNEVLLAFFRFAEGHYRRADGSTTDELHAYRITFRVLKQIYGTTPAASFGPLAFDGRGRLVQAHHQPADLAR